ncbi:hypothetical protein I3760_08G003300 [Carya illinoinensis]|nr:hypothetical protein I3760_08G003300 [Carya illinoinensis]
MEYLSASFLLPLVILCVSLTLVFRNYSYRSISPKLPLGRKGWPINIIGETMDYAMASKSGNPDKFITDRMSKYSSDVFRTSLLGENFAVFCGPSGNKFLFSSENKYVSAWWPRSLRETLHFPSDYSRKGERLDFLHEFLKPEALQDYIPIMDSMAKEHLHANWSPYKEVKVFPLSKKHTFGLACRLFLNIEDPEHVTTLENPFNLLAEGIISLPLNLPGTAFNRAVKAGKVIHEKVLAIIRQRKMELLENKGSAQVDLLSRMLLVTDEKGGGIEEEKEIAARITGLFIASRDTTSSAITFVLNYLAEFPHVYDEILKEQMRIAKSKGSDELLNWDHIRKMKYSWNVVRETMRLTPPCQGAFREVTADFTYAGFTIPKGWKTFSTVHSTHKNPKYFPDPEKFDPSRFEGKGPEPYTYLPFGGGPRMCSGKEYARLQILTFMHNAVIKFKFKKVNPSEKITYGLAPIPKNGLPVRLDPPEC